MRLVRPLYFWELYTIVTIDGSLQVMNHIVYLNIYLNWITTTKCLVTLYLRKAMADEYIDMIGEEYYQEVKDNFSTLLGMNM